MATVETAFDVLSSLAHVPWCGYTLAAQCPNPNSPKLAVRAKQAQGLISGGQSDPAVLAEVITLFCSRESQKMPFEEAGTKGP